MALLPMKISFLFVSMDAMALPPKLFYTNADKLSVNEIDKSQFVELEVVSQILIRACGHFFRLSRTYSFCNLED